MGWIDIFLIIVLAGAFLLGYSEGLIGQIGSLSGIVLGVLAVWILGTPVTNLTASLMGAQTKTEYYEAAFIGCGAMFVLIWGGTWYFGRLLHRFIRKIKLSFVNNLTGAFFMVFKWSLVISLLLNVWHLLSPSSTIFFSSRLLEGRFFHFFMNLGPWIMGYL